MPVKHSIHILYDGNCPICRRKVAFLERRDHKGNLRFSDIRKAGGLPPQTDIPMDQLEKQIHAVLPNGTVISRMDVIRSAYRAIGLGWLAAPTGWPVLRTLFDVLYGLLAKYRQAISRLWR